MVKKNRLSVFIGVVDQHASHALKDFVNRHERLALEGMKDNSYHIQRCVQNYIYDLIIIDVEFPALTAFEILKTIKGPSPVIFISQKKKWAAKAYEFGAVDYIVYPFKINRISKSLNQYLNLVDATVSQSILNRRLVINQCGSQVYIDHKEIVFIMSNGKKSTIFTIDERIEVLMLLKDLHAHLSKLGFVRLHRRYVVNRYYIKSFNQSGERDKVAKIVHDEMEYIPVGRTYFKDLAIDDICIVVR
ncbi:MAG: LytTR family DNA-binding domain-containing protein [Leptospirales bacterium]